MPAVFTVPAVFKAVNKISAPMKQMQKSVKSFGMSAKADMMRASMAVEKLNQRIKRVGRNIKKSVGTIGLAFGMLALVSIVGNGVKVFADFEQANAGLAAVMGKTIKENKALNEDAKRLGATTAKTATEVVGLQEAFARLGFQENDILNMTESTIAGSVAMNAALADTAELVGAMVKTFDDLKSTDAPLIIDQMTLATQKSALNFEKLQTALPIVSGAAEAAGIPFTKLLSLLGKLSDSGIDASSSANALKRIFIESRAKGEDYEQILGRIVKNSDKLTASVDQFGVRASVSSVILSKNIKATNELDQALQNAGGTAEIAARKQLDTLNGRLTILTSAWEGFILSVEDGNGEFSKFLKTSVEVATEFLSMATGTAKLGTELSESELRIRSLAIKLQKVVSIAGKFIKGYIIMIAVQKSLNLAIKAYQLLTKVGHFLRFARVFIKLAKAKGIAAAAQKLLNKSVLANPYVLMAVAIGAAVAMIYKMSKAQTLSEQIQEDIQKRTREIASQQIVDLDKVFRAIKKTVPASKERIALVNQLKDAYPGVNAAMEQEIINTNNLAKSYSFLREEIIKAAKARAIQEKVGEQANKLVDFELKLQELGIDKARLFKEVEAVNREFETRAFGDRPLAEAFNKKYGVKKGFFKNESMLQDARAALEVNVAINDLLTLQEKLTVPSEEYKSNQVILNNNETKPTADNSRVDLFLNNRTSDTEIYTEGTGVNVMSTGN